MTQDELSARLDAHVARVVASFPPLTDEQADRIASILRTPTKESPLSDDLETLAEVRTA